MKQFAVGIDLGTTNCAMACSSSETSSDQAIIIPVPQWISADMIEGKNLLPSFLCIPSPYEHPSEKFAGFYARETMATTPDRVAHSAKSWLSATSVDRLAPLLPWQSDSIDNKLSPVEVSAFYLSQLGRAWDSYWKDRGQTYPLKDQIVTITVPASFDAAARELTTLAATKAGLGHAFLLEEPLAAFYAWLNHHKRTWRNRLRHRKMVLIADIGGGTSDFTLISIEEKEGILIPRRVAVGDHLLAGGDNIDRSLAYLAEHKCFGKRNSLSGQNFSKVTSLCRKAKERLLDDQSPETEFKITLQGKGTSIVQGSKTVLLSKDEVVDHVLDGFFPLIEDYEKRKASIREETATGLVEIGLPYAKDSGVTSNLIRFLQFHEAQPDSILFNGGTMRPAILRDRTISVIEDYLQLKKGELKDLTYDDLDHAVARGATYYGLARSGKGIRVEAHSSRSYYIGFATTANAESTTSAVCIVPSGAPSGSNHVLNSLDLNLVANKPVRFSLYSSTRRYDDKPGTTVDITTDQFTQLPPLKTVIDTTGNTNHSGTFKGKRKKKSKAPHKDTTIPVFLHSSVTELGTLEMNCIERESKKSYQVTFELRQNNSTCQKSPDPVPTDTHGESEGTSIDSKRLESIERTISLTFEAPPSDPKTAKNFQPRSIMKNLEKASGLKRKQWPSSLCRHIFTLIVRLWEHRRKTPETEASWLSIAGFTLRPGFGAPNDEWHMEKMEKLLHEKLQHKKENNVRIAWWIMWETNLWRPQ